MINAQKEFVETQLKQIITRLFKEFLVIIEDVKQDHLSALADMKQFPPEFLARLNYLDLPQYSRIRKKILDKGNDSIREMVSLLGNLQISLGDEVQDEGKKE